eukprot:snap_masked-scaffold_24-processed-gene-0.17-mRNA-1 protein AED:1.00 eAED:1.00 QI:0/-1/0/0/-1/1/1/0/61
MLIPDGTLSKQVGDGAGVVAALGDGPGVVFSVGDNPNAVRGVRKNKPLSIELTARVPDGCM